ncbi:MAG: NAD(P)H-dependent oxidoreductase [Flavobacteriales bacterium]|nr:NAD(P)H-dependent oxidoreductase [Flavobacteriales bacterium]
MKILILSSSVRQGRNSHRVALFLQERLLSREGVEVDLFDLEAVDFPLFSERLSRLEEPSDSLKEYAQRVEQADGVVFVTPEYNGGYPASWKNAFDVLYDQWKGKPAGIASVSTGSFGGSQVQVQMQWVITKVGMLPTGVFPVPKVTENFSETGEALDEKIPGRADKFLDSILSRIS